MIRSRHYLIIILAAFLLAAALFAYYFFAKSDGKNFAADGFILPVLGAEIYDTGDVYLKVLNDRGASIFRRNCEEQESAYVLGSGKACVFDEVSWPYQERLKSGEERIVKFKCPLPKDSKRNGKIGIGFSLGYRLNTEFLTQYLDSGVVYSRTISDADGRLGEEYADQRAGMAVMPIAGVLPEGNGTGSNSMCDAAEYPPLVDQCLKDAAIRKADPFICLKIEDKCNYGFRSSCMDAIGAIYKNRLTG